MLIFDIKTRGVIVDVYKSVFPFPIGLLVRLSNSYICDKIVKNWIWYFEFFLIFKINMSTILIFVQKQKNLNTESGFWSAFKGILTIPLSSSTCTVSRVRTIYQSDSICAVNSIYKNSLCINLPFLKLEFQSDPIIESYIASPNQWFFHILPIVEKT